MLNPDSGALEADPITSIINGSGFGVSSLILFALATCAMIARANLSVHKGAKK